MKNKNDEKEIVVGNPFPNGWDEHEREQILFRVRNSTASQRLETLEQMLKVTADIRRRNGLD